MSKVMLVAPWFFYFENKRHRPARREWRSGPSTILLLATILRNKGHEVAVVDLFRDLASFVGAVEPCLANFQDKIANFKPDIIGISFFSLHCLEVQKIVTAARQQCTRSGLSTLLVAGGIHATVEPRMTVETLGFDYAFVGEGDIGIVRLAEGEDPNIIPGIAGPSTAEITQGDPPESLDTLPFPDWSLCDYHYYDQPSLARIGTRETSGLDMTAGRGCPFRCKFCAYPALSPVRFHSAEYLIAHMQYMLKEFGTRGIYFVDSSIGNNRKLLKIFCESLIAKGIPNQMEWYGNIRADQVNENLLTLMWRAGCRFLFYGFESGSQRMLDLMHKGTKVEDNLKVARLHEKLRFPYLASFVIGYPGETEEDWLKTIAHIRETRPPRCGMNSFTPFPGSPVYDELKQQGRLDLDNMLVWRQVGCINNPGCYTGIPRAKRGSLAGALRAAVKGASEEAKARWQGKAG